LKGNEHVDNPNNQKLWWHGCSSDELERLATPTCQP
jgi:hypothetical protein